MKKITVSGNHLLFISLLLTTLLVTSPAWSASGKKSAAGVVLNQEDNKSVLDKKVLKNPDDNDKGARDNKDLKNGEKNGKSVKKKAVKKAGKAAAVGAAGKKVTSTIQK